MPSLVLISSRPEYRGALTHVSGAQLIALRPLNQAHAATLVTDLLGSDSSLADLAAQLSTRAAGNPFFAEEIVRDLAERGVLMGTPGAYTLSGDADDWDVPATLQATIGARIDRLGSSAKNTLNAAAVIGSQFDTELVANIVENVDIATLVEAELVDQVRFGQRAEYVFRHPLTRSVAYESQLRSARGELHRCVAAALSWYRHSGSVEESAALIAEHLEAAGNLSAAYDWHMRAGMWLTNRDISAARTSWQRALQIADRLPEGDPARPSLQIAPRATLCATAFRMGGRGRRASRGNPRCAGRPPTSGQAIGMNSGRL